MNRQQRRAKKFKHNFGIIRSVYHPKDKTQWTAVDLVVEVSVPVIEKFPIP